MRDLNKSESRRFKKLNESIFEFKKKHEELKLKLNSIEDEIDIKSGEIEYEARKLRVSCSIPIGSILNTELSRWMSSEGKFIVEGEGENE